MMAWRVTAIIGQRGRWREINWAVLKWKIGASVTLKIFVDIAERADSPTAGGNYNDSLSETTVWSLYSSNSSCKSSVRRQSQNTLKVIEQLSMKHSWLGLSTNVSHCLDSFDWIRALGSLTCNRQKILNINQIGNPINSLWYDWSIPSPNSGRLAKNPSNWVVKIFETFNWIKSVVFGHRVPFQKGERTRQHDAINTIKNSVGNVARLSTSSTRFVGHRLQHLSGADNRLANQITSRNGHFLSEEDFLRGNLNT